jgi:5-methylcytosine-specific restriction endonuclease McrA
MITKARIPMIKSRVARAETRRVLPPPKTADSFYLSPEWRALMDQIIAKRGRICEDPECRKPHPPITRIYGDHIKEKRDGGALLDPTNIMLRCGPAHGRKTARERAKRAGVAQ